MPRKGRGGKVAPDGRAVAPAGPGAAATRTDLARPAGTQPIAAPGGLPYGQRQALENAQRAIPLPEGGGGALPATGSPAPGGSQTLPPPPAGTPLGAPTTAPNEPISAGLIAPDQALAFKVDALRYLASLPSAGPEVSAMLRKAQFELDETQHAQMSLPPGLLGG